METLSKNRFKQLRLLKARKGRTEQGRYVAEGARLLSEALKAKVYPEYVVISDAPSDDALAISERFRAESVEVVTAEAEEFKNLSDTVTTQGVLGVFAQPQYDLSALVGADRLTLLVLDNLRDPGNLGTIVRQAAAFNCGALLLLKGCVDPFNSKAVRSSMGGIFHIPLFMDLAADTVMETLQANGVWPYVTSTKGENAFRVEFPPKTAFIIGGETEGVQQVWKEHEVIEVGVPQTEKVESLNAAVAAGIFLAYRYQGE